MIDDKLTNRIIGCAMKVHRTLGKGFEEKIYQRALALEFFAADIQFKREVEMLVYYNGRVIGKKRVDFLVEESLVIELKALAEMTESHLAQAICYCQVQEVPYGLLINFGASSLQFRRVFNPNHPINKDYKATI
jgi:GxxExxY protein